MWDPDFSGITTGKNLGWHGLAISGSCDLCWLHSGPCLPYFTHGLDLGPALVFVAVAQQLGLISQGARGQPRKSDHPTDRVPAEYLGRKEHLGRDVLVGACRDRPEAAASSRRPPETPRGRVIGPSLMILGKVDSWIWRANVTDTGDALLRQANRGCVHGLVGLKIGVSPSFRRRWWTSRAATVVPPGTTRLTHVPCDGRPPEGSTSGQEIV